MSKDRSRTAVYCGYFNPPHLGHVEAARTIAEQLKPERLLIIPSHLDIPDDATDWPAPEERLNLCALAFRDIPNASVLDADVLREGKSYYTVTMETVREMYPDDELLLVVGSDTFREIEDVYLFSHLAELCTITVLARNEDDLSELEAKAIELKALQGAECMIIHHDPLHIKSDMVRNRLGLRLGREQLSDEVYSQIIKHRFYGAEVELSWLREQVIPYLNPNRVAHVTGCESEAVTLAMQYGENTELAAEAAILHDITKAYSHDKNLELCEQYGLQIDDAQRRNRALLHAVTGAALAKDLFGASDEVCEAIRWHTTGKPDMSLLEKIIYLADYIEPSRDFDGVETLRELAAEDLDAAIAMGLHMSLEDIQRRGIEAYKDTIDAENWYNKGE